MPKGGLEPPRPFEHNALNVACLPISPLRLRHYITVSLATCQEDSSSFPFTPRLLRKFMLYSVHIRPFTPGYAPSIAISAGCNYKRVHKMPLPMLHDGDLLSPARRR